MGRGARDPGRLALLAHRLAAERALRAYCKDKYAALVMVEMTSPSPQGRITPGCTGLWKLYASKHKDGTFNSTVFHDIYYARNMTPMLDIYIILETVRIILSGRVDG